MGVSKTIINEKIYEICGSCIQGFIPFVVYVQFGVWRLRADADITYAHALCSCQRSTIFSVLPAHIFLKKNPHASKCQF